MTRPQKGYLYKAFGAWHVRYREDVWQPDGTTKRVQVSKRIASLEECPRKADAQRLAYEMMYMVNTEVTSPCSTMPLVRFVEEVYLPHVEAQNRASTLKGYRNIWRTQIKPRVGEIRVRDFRTWNGERLLKRIASELGLSRSSLKHTKSVLSAIFKHTKRCGAISGVNPVQDVSIPHARESEDTHAYSLEEIYRMLELLPDPALTVVATAAFTGLRKGELRGLRWENYTGEEIQVRHSVWNRHVTDPKTRKSKAPVPVIAPLQKFLERYRAAVGQPQTGWMFAAGKGTPLHLDNLARRVIKPLLEKAGIEWHGWHAFRRGLATTLQRQGVTIKTAQAILRHADYETTANHYIKTVDADAVQAMELVEKACNERAMEAFEASSATVVN
ncbi:MAG: site-specific integrase [Acidobacteriia bacterium]|nr:site-specific integrase [Terriglobia bacterium]